MDITTNNPPTVITTAPSSSSSNNTTPPRSLNSSGEIINNNSNNINRSPSSSFTSTWSPSNNSWKTTAPKRDSVYGHTPLSSSQQSLLSPNRKFSNISSPDISSQPTTSSPSTTVAVTTIELPPPTFDLSNNQNNNSVNKTKANSLSNSSNSSPTSSSSSLTPPDSPPIPHHNNNNSSTNNNLTVSGKNTVKKQQHQSIFSHFLSFAQTSSPHAQPSGYETVRLTPPVGDEILVKVWVPMEYTGQLYRVRKFSGGKSTQDIVQQLNSQLAPIYQSPKNKLFLNNDDKPVPNVSLKNLNLTSQDILYLRREPEYELIAPSYLQKGPLILDKDIKVGEMLVRIEQWLEPEDAHDNNVNSLGASGQHNHLNQSGGGAKYRPEYFQTMEDHNLMIVGGEKDGEHHVVSNYKLLKKLCLPTQRPIGKVSRGYYLRLYDQKQISNYGIKIKDTLIFKKKIINRGLCVDDADGGIEISVVYSPLSMVPTFPEADANNLTSSKEKEKEKQQDLNPAQKDLLIKVERLSVIDPTMMPAPNSPPGTPLSQVIDEQISLSGTNGLSSGGSIKQKKHKSRRTPSNVGLPFNLVHKTHVDFEYKWSGANLEDSFEFKEKLGQGGYGAVFRALHRESGTILAVKVLSITPSRIADIEKEIDLLKKCRCNSVLSYYGSIAKLAELWILMDYCAVGSVKDMMKTCCDTLDEEQIAAVASDVLSGLGYLHSKGIVHLDVKAANILLTEDGQVKIADFGVSQQLQTPYGQSSILIGSPLYMAPELILKAPFNSKADVWSFGITLIELAEGRPPSRGLKSMAQLVEVPNMPPPKLSNPKDWSPSFNDFISKCLIKDPEERPSVGDLMAHPFIQNTKSKDCLGNMIKQCVQIRDAQKDNDQTIA